MLDLDNHASRMEIVTDTPDGEVTLETDSTFDIVHIEGGSEVQTQVETAHRISRLSVKRQAIITYRSEPISNAKLIMGDGIEVG